MRRVRALGAIASHLYAHTFAELYLDEEHFPGVVSHWHQRRTHQYAFRGAQDECPICFAPEDLSWELR